MPIYQRPSKSIGNTRTFSGTITDSGSTPIQGAVVVLRRKGSDSILRYVETDASGNYSFDVNADGSFIVSYATSKDPNDALVETVEYEPTQSYAYYSDTVDYFKSVLYVGNFPGAGGSSASWYVSQPSTRVVDPYPNGLDDALANNKPFRSVKDPAVIKVVLANTGDPYRDYSSRVINDGTGKGNFAKPLRHFVIESIGKGYVGGQVGLLVQGERITTTRGSQQSAQDLFDQQPGVFNRILGPDDSNNWHLTQTDTLRYFCATAAGDISDQASFISSCTSYWGSDISTYTTPSSDWTDGYFSSAAIPGQLIRTDFNTAPVDQSVFLNGITNPDVTKLHGMQIYYTVIYGSGGTPQNPTSGGAVDAYNRGLISLQELDILKGYFGRHFYVPELAGALSSTSSAMANAGNFLYQMTQAYEQITNGFPNANTIWSQNNFPTSFFGYLTGYAGSIYKTVMNNVAAEFRSFLRQSKGTAVPTSKYSAKIYPILFKAGISTIQTVDGNTTRNWSITPSNINYQ